MVLKNSITLESSPSSCVQLVDLQNLTKLQTVFNNSITQHTYPIQPFSGVQLVDCRVSVVDKSGGSSVIVIFMAVLIRSVKKHLVMGLLLLALICQVPVECAIAGNFTFHRLQGAGIYRRAQLRPFIDCGVACDTRCGKDENCITACIECCNQCGCVPPGKIGDNRGVCGDCYTDKIAITTRTPCP